MRAPVLPTSCQRELNNGRSLTPYDQGSVMHYQWCSGVATTDLVITAQDTAGIRQLYGAPGQAFVAMSDETCAVGDINGDGLSDAVAFKRGP